MVSFILTHAFYCPVSDADKNVIHFMKTTMQQASSLIHITENWPYLHLSNLPPLKRFIIMFIIVRLALILPVLSSQSESIMLLCRCHRSRFKCCWPIFLEQYCTLTRLRSITLYSDLISLIKILQNWCIINDHFLNFLKYFIVLFSPVPRYICLFQFS